MLKLVAPFLGVALGGLLMVAPGNGGIPAPPGLPGGPPAKADRDGNKIFDDLEANLKGVDDRSSVKTLVTLTQSATTPRLDGLMHAVGDFGVSHRFSIINGFSATLTKGQVEALARLPLVVHVEEDSVVQALNDAPQASFGVTKARTDIPSLDGNCGNATNPVCAPNTYGPADYVAAVIDTGIDTGHLDLDQGKVIGWKDFVNGGTTPYDDNGHGTHVSATIAGDGDARTDLRYKGGAPDAALVGVKVLSASGSGTMSNVTAAIDWVVQNKATYGIEAINLSLGANGCSDGTDATSSAVDNAVASGIAVFVAAGNSGPGTCTIGSPGAAKDAITVGAMGDMSQNGFKQAYFSSRGPTLDGRIKPDVSAPGVNVTSAQAGTTNGYVVYSGTSMATPFTTGVGLLMLDANPTLTPLQIKSKLMSTSIDWGRGGNNTTPGSTGVDIDYGAGRLDAYAAIASAGASLNAPPAMPVHTLKSGTLSGTGAITDYKINVTDTQFPIAATLIMPGISGGSAFSPDFDLYLYNPSGTELARGYTTRRQEEVGYKPTVTGTYTVRVQSYSGGGDYFVDISAGTSVAAPDFTLSASPSSASTVQGSSTGAKYTVSVAAISGYAGTVNLSASGLPSGATASFSPASVASAGTSQLTVTTTATTGAGSYPLTITGRDSSGAPTHTAAVTLVVTTPPQPDFTLSASPASASVAQGGSAPYTVTVSPTNGFNGAVTLSVSGQPVGSTVAWTPSATVTGGSGSSTLTVTTTAGTATGSYTLTISGTSGSLSHSATAGLSVNASSPLTTVKTPTAVTILQGSLAGGSVSSLAADDGSYLTVAAGFTTYYVSSWYGSFFGMTSTASNLTINYKGGNSASCTQAIGLWSFTLGRWINLDTQTVGAETPVSVVVAGSLSEYVSAGELRVRVRCAALASFANSGNLLQISYTP